MCIINQELSGRCSAKVWHLIAMHIHVFHMDQFKLKMVQSNKVLSKKLQFTVLEASNHTICYLQIGACITRFENIYTMHHMDKSICQEQQQQQQRWLATHWWELSWARDRQSPPRPRLSLSPQPLWCPDNWKMHNEQNALHYTTLGTVWTFYYFVHWGKGKSSRFNEDLFCPVWLFLNFWWSINCGILTPCLFNAWNPVYNNKHYILNTAYCKLHLKEGK